MTWWQILLIILAVILVLLVVLYFVGSKMQRKQAVSQEQMDAMKQTLSMLIIDKKKMKLKDANLPDMVLQQTPKYMRRMKMPFVKAKVIRVTDKKAAQNDSAVQEAVKAVAEALGDTGRILVRESGTEPLVRVMVEAPDHDTCQKYVSQVVEVIKSKGYAV